MRDNQILVRTIRRLLGHICRSMIFSGDLALELHVEVLNAA